MDPVVTNILVGLTCSLVGFLYSRRQQAIKRVYSEAEHQEQLTKRTRAFTLTLEAVGAGVVTEVSVLKETLLAEIDRDRTHAAKELIALRDRNLDSVKQATAEAAESGKNRLAELQEGLDRATAQAKAEYARLDKHFRESKEDDITISLVHAAYEVAASNHHPRNPSDSALVQAVLRHSKSGGIVKPNTPDAPESKDLN